MVPLDPRTIIPSATVKSFLLFLVLGAAPALFAQRTILIDTRENLFDPPTITVNGSAFAFPSNDPVPVDTLHGIRRLDDGTVEISIKGDLVLNSDDTLRGVGHYPVVIRVGNDAYIPPGAHIDFSAISVTAGAGGGGAKAGGSGGRGGEGGRGGRGGEGGTLGSGGLNYTPPGSPVSVTTPGSPAGDGTGGGNGQQGEDGQAGSPGRKGSPGFSNSLSSAGLAGDEGELFPAMAKNADGGSRGQAAAYPPPIFFQGGALRSYLYFVDQTAADFTGNYYDGARGIGGDDAEDYTPADSAAHTDGPGQDGSPATQPADLWTLSGGSSGGSGGGGAGGAGGTGGGGGGGGAGGHGEWPEPITTGFITTDILEAAVGVAAQIDDAVFQTGVEKVISKVIQAYIKNGDFDISLIPVVDYGATGGSGGDGGDGGFGGQGGRGGDGGAGGAGGGALLLEVQGRIFLEGKISANGADGVAGAPGQAALNIFSSPLLGTSGSARLHGFGMSSALSPVSFALDLLEDPRAGLGGRGGDGGEGGKGAPGFMGGDGAGGSAGTIILSSSSLLNPSGLGSLEVEGGESTDPSLKGEDGRVFIGSNTIPDGSLTTSTLANETLALTGTIPASTTRVGPRALNPFIAGKPLTPTLSELRDGAEAFGFLTELSDSLMVNGVDLRSNVPSGGDEPVICAMRLDVGPPPYDEDYHDHDLILVFNFLNQPLTEVRFGANPQALVANPNYPGPGEPEFIPDPANLSPYQSVTLTEGGHTRDPSFGGSGDLASGDMLKFEIFALLVPEDTATTGHNFAISAKSGTVTFRFEEDHFTNGELICATGNADVPTYVSEWMPDSGGPDGNWNVASNWDTTLDGVPAPDVVPNNQIEVSAYDVGINLADADVAQDTDITIDRLRIGATNTLTIQNTFELLFKKFDVRENGGLIENQGTIRLDSTILTPSTNTADFTSLKLQGQGLVFSGPGILTTSLSPNNLIASDLVVDSFIQESDHSILASGMLGNGKLNFTNDGDVKAHSGTGDTSRQSLLIDPSYDAAHHSPPFVNGGTLLVGGEFSELHLTDGYYENLPGGLIGFDTPGAAAANRQTLGFHDLRLVGGSETVAASNSGQLLNLTGTNILEDMTLTAETDGVLFLNNTDLTLRNATLRVDDANNFTNWSSSSPAFAFTHPGHIRNSTVTGGTLSFVDPGGLFTCATPSPFAFDTPVDFNYYLDGSLVTLRNTTIDGSYCHDRSAVLQDQYGTESFYNLYPDGRPLSNAYVTPLVHATQLALEGTLNNNGLVRLFGNDVLIGPHTILDGTGAFDGNGLFQTDGNGPSFLTIGPNQNFFGTTFRGTDLEVENNGRLFGVSWDYDPDPAGAPTDPDELLAFLRTPFLATNNNHLQPAGTFGGGTIDNSGGIIGLGDGTPDFENVLIEGGLVTLDHFRDTGWLEYELADLDGQSANAFNTRFRNVIFNAPNFQPDPGDGSLVLNDDVSGIEHQARHLGLIQFQATGINKPPLVSSLTPVELDNVRLATHTHFSSAVLSRALTIDTGVFVHFGHALIDGNTPVIPNQTDPGTPFAAAFSFTGGIGGTSPQPFTLPPGITSYGDGNWGQDTLSIVNNGPIYYDDPGPYLHFGFFPFDYLTLDAPGDATSAVGFVNNGTIEPHPNSFGSSVLFILPGHYDNTNGTITYAWGGGTRPTIDGALIEGGLINDLGYEQIGSATELELLNGSTLRNLQLQGIDLFGDATNTLDNVTLLPPPTGSSAPPAVLSGTFTVLGDLTYDAPGYNFTLNEVPTFNTAGDRLVLASGTTITIESATQALTSLDNSGTMVANDQITLSTPTIPTGFTLSLDTLVADPNAPLGTLVSLQDLGFTSPLDLVSSSTIRNAGTFSGDSEIDITRATINNEDGTITAFDKLTISESLIQNHNGTLTSATQIELYNSILLDGTLDSIDIFVSSGALGTDSVTTFRDVTLPGTPYMVNGASLAILGDTGGTGIELENYGDLLIAGDDTTFTVDSTYNSGTLTLGGGTLESPGYFESDGIIQGTGTILTAGFENYGILSPGLSAGQLDITGDVYFYDSTTFEIELGGTSPGTGFDQINLTPDFDLLLDGTLEVSIIDDFGLCYEDTFPVITSTTAILGDFTGLTSGSRIPVATGGTIAVYYGPGSPHAPNHVVLTEYIAGPSTFLSSPYSGNYEVTQLGPGNSPSDISLTTLPGTTTGMSHAATLSNRGDYALAFPSGITPLADGIVIPSVSQTTRTQVPPSGGSAVTDYPTACIFDDAGTYYVGTHGRTINAEFNTNFAASFFRFDEWLCGYAENNAGNGTNADALAASPGITLGTEFSQSGPGQFTVDLTAFGANRDDGILLTTASRNDDNITTVSPQPDGTFDIYVRDNGVTSPTSYENDPISFVYIPFDAANRSPLVAAARIEGDGDTHRGTRNLDGEDNFTINKTGNNTYDLRIPGHTPQTGVLLVSAQGGTLQIRDNYVSYTPSGDKWTITSHSAPGTTDPSLSSAGFTFSFAFFAPTQPIQVTTCLDELDPVATDGTGISLREAVRDSSPGSIISFAPTMAGQTVQVTDGQVLIDKELTLDGSTVASGITLSGTGTSRLFEVAASTTLTVDSLTFRDGNATGDGGAFLVNGHLILQRSSLVENTCTGNGGAIATVNGGTAFLRNSTLAYNSAPGGNGGAISHNPSPVLDYFTIDGAFLTIAYNSALDGGAVHSTNELYIYESIFSLNTAPTFFEDYGPGFENDNAYIDWDGLRYEEGDPEYWDPRLLPLANYGGLTPTLHLSPNSPAIGTSGGYAFRNADQRGFTQGIEDDTIGATLIGGYDDISAIWLTDHDNDGLTLGLETILGTNPAVADYDDTRHGPQLSRNGLNQPTITVSRQGYLSDTLLGQYSVLRLYRSTDLENWREIFRDDEANGVFSQPGYSFTYDSGAQSYIITETANPPAPRAFYRIEALLFEYEP